MATLDQILSEVSELDEKLSNLEDRGKRTDVICKHLEKVTSRTVYKIPELSQDFEWLNVSKSLKLCEELAGKILVLDFFTYCCINCIHVLPDLHCLEQTYTVEDGVIVLGVHSAKFMNEKITANILSAILRYDITHPVINDSEATLWQKLQIMCWPTFVLVGPDGQYLYTLVGEGHREQLLEFVNVAVDFFKENSQIKSHSIPLDLEKDKLPKSALKFPGKVAVSCDKIVISDTGNHRIVITDLNGIVQDTIGGNEKGFKDGNYSNVRFSSPQGICIHGDVIYVADTDNHAIRKIDLRVKNITTVVGNGTMGTDKEGGAIGVNQSISSPWDVCIGQSPGGDEDNILYIAMAGNHQIWVYFLQDDIPWYKGMKYPQYTCVRFAGSGLEENKNNSYPHKAGFAQPSGLALSNNVLYVADSESSSIRQIHLKDGSVKALVGGDRDPTNLFAFGDEDGKGINVKLQHPLGVGVWEEKKQLYIADSYNHKIKCVDLTTNSCTTIKGGNYNEPGGLAVYNERLYIADTNNNDIKILDLNTLSVSKLPIIFQDETDYSINSKPRIKVDQKIVLETVNCLPCKPITVMVKINLKDGKKLNTDAPNSWKVLEEDQRIQVNPKKGNIKECSSNKITECRIIDNQTKDVQLQCLFQLFICTDDSTCKVCNILVQQPVLVSTSNISNSITLNIQI